MWECVGFSRGRLSAASLGPRRERAAILATALLKLMNSSAAVGPPVTGPGPASCIQYRQRVMFVWALEHGSVPAESASSFGSLLATRKVLFGPNGQVDLGAVYLCLLTTALHLSSASGISFSNSA
jgi:hypothetical protein